MKAGRSYETYSAFLPERQYSAPPFKSSSVFERRLYGIALPTWQAHWWDFCALFAPLAATEGSLVGQAIAARQPTPAGTGREQRRALSRLRRAWALPPTDDELVRQANERIRREW